MTCTLHPLKCGLALDYFILSSKSSSMLLDHAFANELISNWHFLPTYLIYKKHKCFRII